MPEKSNKPEPKPVPAEAKAAPESKLKALIVVDNGEESFVYSVNVQNFNIKKEVKFDGLKEKVKSKMKLNGFVQKQFDAQQGLKEANRILTQDRSI